MLNRIYSALYNDLGETVLVCPGIINTNFTLISNNSKILFERYQCAHGHSTVFVLAGQAYSENITIQSGEDDEIVISLEKPESCQNLIIMSTIVRNEDEYILQWINYHLFLGVHKFIIYDNVENNDPAPMSGHLIGKGTSSNLAKLLANYIDSGQVTLIDWSFKVKFQQTQQNHSIWAYKNAAYIGFFDVDEYVNPQIETIQIPDLIQHCIKKKNLNSNNIGGFKFANLAFYNPFSLPEKNYDFLNIYNTDLKFNSESGKCFINPKNTQCYSVHGITIGKEVYEIDVSDAYFNHYIF